MEVIKSGRGSGKTYGRVTDIEGIIRIRYGSLERMVRSVLVIEPYNGSPEVSRPGDSGAWWLDASTMHTIGLHFAGSYYPERALAIDMQSVLDALNVRIADE